MCRAAAIARSYNDEPVISERATCWKSVPFAGIKARACVCVGPTAAADDPPGHAEYLWNLRYGVN